MKNYTILSLLIIMFVNLPLTAQVGINTTNPDGSSILDVSANDKGVLIPRIALTGTNDTTTITTPQTSLLVYNTATVLGANGVSPNFYYWDGTMWRLLRGDDWKVTGNDNTASGTNFLGTTNAEELDFRVNNTLRYRISTKGQLEFFDDGDAQSIMIGFEAGENYDPSVAGHNVFLGYQAGRSTTDAWDLVAIGTAAMINNTTGEYNTAVGAESMEQNTTGENNTAVGDDTMRLNTTGSDNTAVGRFSLFSNDSGNRNSAVGVDALGYNIGNDNASLGFSAGLDLVNGSSNVFVGAYSNPTSGTIARATAIGYNTRVGNNDAVAIGENSRATGLRSVAMGSDAIASGSDSIAIGNNATATSGDGIAIGNGATVNFNQSIVLGNGASPTKANQLCYGAITEIDQGSAVIVNASDERFKYDIRENVSGLDFIMQLRPVTYKFDVEKYNSFRGIEASVTNSEKTETGFLAQEVEAALESIDYDFNGLIKPEDINNDNYKVSYSLFVVPLVKAVQQQQGEINRLKEKIAQLEELKATIDQLKATLLSD